jgi:hypothetical protein
VLVGDRLDRNEHADRHAPLPRRTEARVHRRVGDEVEVGIRKHQHVVLRPTERLDPFAVIRSGLVDVRMFEQGPTATLSP